MASDITHTASPALVQSLVGVKVRCPRCGQLAGRLLRVRHLWPRRHTDYFLHCRHCHQHPWVHTQVQALQLVTAVAPDSVDALFPAG